MQHLKTFENFKIRIKESNHYAETSWSDGDVTITIKDVEEYLDSNNIQPTEIKVDEIADMCVHNGKKDEATLKRAQAADLSFPIIMAENNGERVMILDGHHRLKKAIDNGVENIMTRVLELSDAPEEFRKMFAR